MPAVFSASGTLPRLLLSTAVLVIATFLVHRLVSGYIRRNVQSADLRRRWLVSSRNGLVLLLFLGLVMIWGEELRAIALSIVAVAVAFVVATKELILCVTGAIMKVVTRPFNIGDRIQIKDLRGDVIDQNLLATTILEVGPGKLTHQRTGRMIVIPNAVFLSEPIINESYTDDYILHVFTVPFKREDDWQSARKALLESARRHCAPYLDDVRQYMEQLSRQRGLDIPTVDPRVTVQIPTAGEVHLVVRVPAKSGQRGYIEQAIIMDVLGTEGGEREEPREEVPAG